MTLPRLRYATFALLSVLIALLSARAYVLPLIVGMPNMVHYLGSVPLPMWGHLVFAPLALLLAPFQMATRLRNSRPLVHRIIGYTYALSVLLAGLASLTMLPHFQGTAWAQSGFALLALLWIGFTATGIGFAIRGDYRHHRVWMLRSVALTFAAVTLRLIMPFLMAAGWSLLETYDVTAWASWLINLAVVEYYLRRGSFHTTRLA